MKWFKPKYRIMRNLEGYYYVQSKDWTWPFWLRERGIGFSASADVAEARLGEMLRNEREVGVVKELGRL